MVSSHLVLFCALKVALLPLLDPPTFVESADLFRISPTSSGEYPTFISSSTMPKLSTIRSDHVGTLSYTVVVTVMPILSARELCGIVSVGHTSSRNS